MKLVTDLGTKNKWKRRRGIYECPLCFEENEHTTRDVVAGKITKCKKCSNKLRALKHGQSNTDLYKVWVEMRNRCQNKNNQKYDYYGGRGISVDILFSEFEDFKNWSELNGYKKGLTIDRKDNDGNYTPLNCRWVTMKIQSQNKRRKLTATSKHEGVSWKKANKKWAAQYEGKYLGLFEHEIDAANAVKQKRDEKDEMDK